MRAYYLASRSSPRSGKSGNSKLNTDQTMSIFSDISRASMPTGGGNYFTPGRYWGRITKTVLQKSQRSPKTFFVNEVTILKVLDEQDGSNRVNQQVAQVVDTSKEMFLPNFKQFLVGCTACDPDAITPEDCESATGDEQPLAGQVVEIDVTEIQTRAGQPFNKVTYVRPVGDDEVAAEGI